MTLLNRFKYNKRDNGEVISPVLGYPPWYDVVYERDKGVLYIKTYGRFGSRRSNCSIKGFCCDSDCLGDLSEKHTSALPWHLIDPVPGPYDLFEAENKYILKL